jgi:oxygen-independent coproporphyrinogen-3 oxidase
VHAPFCARRCSYCDFAITVRGRVPTDEYVDGLRQELANRFPEGELWEAHTLYLGGGTPSHLGGAGVAQLLATVRARISLPPAAEVTLEANPEDVTAESVRAWLDAGVTRVSLGAQSFDARALAWMHRVHDPARTERAANALAQAGVRDWSLDLIFALPASLGRDWSVDLSRALDLAPTHLSLYGLTIEPRTALEKWRARGECVESSEDTYGEEYLLAHERLMAAGFEHYEVSNFARPGFRSRHNASYWSGAPYVGLGPAAHGFDGVVRRWNAPAYRHWLQSIRSGQDPVEGMETLTDENRTAESVYLGLRTDAGLALAAGELEFASRWRDEGWAVIAGQRLQLTATGWLRMDAIAAALTDIRSR